MNLLRDRIDAVAINSRLGWKKAPRPLGDDAWVFEHPVGRRIIVSYDDVSEPGVEWIHASASHRDTRRMPSYGELKQMHAAVFSGPAYQVFVPPDEHINIRSNVLHLWGRMDGAPALPNFGRFGTI